MAYTEFDPYEGAPEGAGEAWLRDQGWSKFVEVGDGDACSLRIRTFQRQLDDKCEYMLDVWGTFSGSPFLKVDGLGELMDLLARWAPAVQAASIVHVLEDAIFPALDDDGVAEVIAAKFAYGQSRVLPALERSRKERIERMAADRAARKARQVESQA